jgi:hypothetical protein
LMAVMAEAELADATKCTGEPTLEPAAGEETVTPANAAPVMKIVASASSKNFRMLDLRRTGG